MSSPLKYWDIKVWFYNYSDVSSENYALQLSKWWLSISNNVNNAQNQRHIFQAKKEKIYNIIDWGAQHSISVFALSTVKIRVEVIPSGDDLGYHNLRHSLPTDPIRQNTCLSKTSERKYKEKLTKGSSANFASNIKKI